MARKPDTGNGTKTTKAFAYRDAASKLGKEAPLDQVHEHILANFGINMTKAQISQYRSNEKNKKRRRGRPRKIDAGVVTPSKAATSKFDTVLDFISTIRSWENRIGASEICKAIDALYKSK